MTTSAAQAPVLDGLISAEELAARWGCSVTSIYKMNLKGLPRFRVGPGVQYDPVAADAWLVKHRARGDAPGQ